MIWEDEDDFLPLIVTTIEGLVFTKPAYGDGPGGMAKVYLLTNEGWEPLPTLYPN